MIPPLFIFLHVALAILCTPSFKASRFIFMWRWYWKPMFYTMGNTWYCRNFVLLPAWQMWIENLISCIQILFYWVWMNWAPLGPFVDHLWAICVSSSLKCLIQSFVHLKNPIVLLIFFYLFHLCSWYIWNSNFFVAYVFANIFPFSSLSIFFTVSFHEHLLLILM